jgi:hypothetical protein
MLDKGKIERGPRQLPSPRAPLFYFEIDMPKGPQGRKRGAE